MKTRFRLAVVGPQHWDEKNDNVDVEVELSDGRKYSATFFTIENVRSIFDKNKRTGECESGLYFWAADMILVERLSLETMEKTVGRLLDDGEFEAAFMRIN